MTKKKNKSANPSADPSTKSATTAPDNRSFNSTSDLRENKEIWYKICVLVHDVRNVAKDKSCENRTLQTTDELYLSAPYFTEAEATAIKAARTEEGITVYEAITTKLKNFVDKRQASGDFRPCGPHDMGPVYLECFGMSKADVEDEKFLSRLRRCGLGKN